MNEKLNNLLGYLQILDPNGWATLTDGSLDDTSIRDQISIVEDAIEHILETNK